MDLFTEQVDLNKHPTVYFRHEPPRHALRLELYNRTSIIAEDT